MIHFKFARTIIIYNNIIFIYYSKVFTVGKGGLWHMWELECGGVWNPWEYVGHPASAITSHPTIVNDDKGWWAAYAVSLVTCTFSNTLNL